ncbi:Bis(5'-nucleosyl)-tetraphosphatase [asymmetrical] [Madurella mycetomatis]|uniref:Bis(5'-adenosyl)-triphosphatase n=1 Tax=Madurella mycetomatis TaxID=100816 RepID=A0A175W6M0_9PEZI|nr:Bis(5'-nucleosyl)-tetraphosphatase [asymmetrical] [Madurella mycetomatis]
MTSSSDAGQPPAQHGNQQRSPKQTIYFGPFDVTSQVFLTTRHSFALVNLKPLLPGHVLVCPLVPHRRLTDLSAGELTDLMVAVQRVQRMLARQFFSISPPSPSSPSFPFPANQPQPQSQSQSQSQAAAPEQGSFNIALQDGPEAGQTVPHVHVHVIPRIRGSTAKPAETPSDALYERMADEDGNVGGALWDLAASASSAPTTAVMGERPRPGGSFPSIEDASRIGRSMAEMEEEAAGYRRLLEMMGREDGLKG